MTAQTTARTNAAMLPIGIAALPDGATACASCGLPTRPEDAAATEERRVLAREIPPAGTGRVEPADQVLTFAVCASCAERQALAASIAEAHPAFLSLGHTHIVAERIAAALDALAAAGVTPNADAYLSSYPAARSLLERLSSLGVSAAWASRFSPVWQEGASPSTCASEPWLFVPSDTTAAIRRALSEHMGDLRPPRPIRHPEGSGCAVCGVATVTARRADEAWSPGRGNSVWLCPADAAIVDDEGGMIGPSVLERSVCDLVDPDRLARRRRPYEPTLAGLTAFADLPPSERDQGSPERWAHIDLDGLRDLLEHGAW